MLIVTDPSLFMAIYDLWSIETNARMHICISIGRNGHFYGDNDKLGETVKRRIEKKSETKGKKITKKHTELRAKKKRLLFKQ